MTVRKAALAPFVRRAPDAGVDWTERSNPVVGTGHTTYGPGSAARVQGDDLASRTNTDGTMQPYSADDPAVFRKLFGIEIE